MSRIAKTAARARTPATAPPQATVEPITGALLAAAAP